MMWMGLELLETGWDMMPAGHCIQVRHGGGRGVIRTQERRPSGTAHLSCVGAKFALKHVQGSETF